MCCPGFPGPRECLGEYSPLMRLNESTILGESEYPSPLPSQLTPQCSKGYKQGAKQRFIECVWEEWGNSTRRRMADTQSPEMLLCISARHPTNPAGA